MNLFPILFHLQIKHLRNGPTKGEFSPHSVTSADKHVRNGPIKGEYSPHSVSRADNEYRKYIGIAN